MRTLFSVPLLVVLAVSGCAQTETVDGELAKLRGQPARSVIDRLGKPDSEQASAAGTVYAWTVETRVMMPVTRTVTDYSSGRPNTVEQTTMEQQRQTCILNVSANAAGTVDSVDVRGPNAACAPLTKKATGRQ